MTEKERILVVDDEPRSWEYLDTLLEEDGFDVETIASGEDAIERVQNGDRPDVIIIPHVAAPGLDGLDTLKQLMRVDRSFKVIVLSCSNEVKTAVEAIHLGARDFLTLPFDKPKLKLAMQRCRERQPLAEGKATVEYCDAITQDWFFLAAAPQMVRIRQQILQIAPVDLPVFIGGASMKSPR